MEFCLICGKGPLRAGSGHWNLGRPCPRWGQPGSRNAQYDPAGREQQEAAAREMQRLVEAAEQVRVERQRRRREFVAEHIAETREILARRLETLRPLQVLEDAQRAMLDEIEREGLLAEETLEAAARSGVPLSRVQGRSARAAVRRSQQMGAEVQLELARMISRTRVTAALVEESREDILHFEEHLAEMELDQARARLREQRRAARLQQEAGDELAHDIVVVR